MTFGNTLISPRQLEPDLFGEDGVGEDWPRAACPTCGKHETLELLAHQRVLWETEAFKKARQSWEGAHEWAEFIRRLPRVDSYLKKPHERCVGCGTVYDPYFATRVEIMKKNIEALKARALHPLERLAEETG